MHAGCLGHIAASPLHETFEIRAFKRPFGFVEIVRRGVTVATAARLDSRRQVLGLNARSGTQAMGALDGVLQLTHVAGPGMVVQHVQRRFAEALYSARAGFVEAGDKVLRQHFRGQLLQRPCLDTDQLFQPDFHPGGAAIGRQPRGGDCVERRVERVEGRR